MNKNKKLYNQSLDPTSMVVDIDPIFNDNIGFDFQSINHLMSKKTKKTLNENGLLPKYFEYVAIGRILPTLQLPFLGACQIINLKVGTKTIKLACMSTQKINGETCSSDHLILWMTYDEYIKGHEMSYEEYERYITNIFEDQIVMV